jgi:cytochrome c biogenesis protein CcmG, thiol:disulfide interchange protein DsbE
MLARSSHRLRAPAPLLWVLAGVALLGLGAIGWFVLLQPAPPPSESGPARVGATAPEVRLPLTTGGMADLAGERGKVVLLNFWATWCAPCRAEMPGLQQLTDDLQGTPFALYSVNLQEDAPTIQPFVRELGLHMPVLLDEDGDVTRAYGVRALPATFLVDRQGVLRQQRLGPLVDGDATTAWSRAWLDNQVRALLAAG